MAPVELVIFDLDGTLLDHRGAVTDAVTRWLTQRGVEPTDELVHAWFAAEKRHLPAWRSGEISFPEQRRRRLRDFLPMAGITVGDDERLDQTFAGYLACYQAAWRVFDDVDSALARVRHIGIGTAVLTNGTVEQQNAKIAAVGLTGRPGSQDVEVVQVPDVQRDSGGHAEPPADGQVGGRIGLGRAEFLGGEDRADQWDCARSISTAPERGHPAKHSASPRWLNCPTSSPRSVPAGGRPSVRIDAVAALTHECVSDVARVAGSGPECVRRLGPGRARLCVSTERRRSAWPPPHQKNPRAPSPPKTT